MSNTNEDSGKSDNLPIEKNDGSGIKNLTKSLFESIEMMSVQKGKGPSFDFNALSESQKDKVLELMDKSESNAFQYHSKKLGSDEKIKLKEIDSVTISQRTNRVALMIGLLGALVLSIVILFYKDTFFMAWLTFLTGLAGGFGLAKASSSDKTNKFYSKNEESDN